MREGKRIRTEHLDVRAIASPLGFPRVGIVVPRFGHTAVDRNRLKRRLREIIRLRVLRSLDALDVVVRASPRAYALSMADLDSTLCGVARRLGPTPPR